MNKQSLTICYQVFDNESQLNKEDLELLNQAVIASNGAYAPYSDFKVGAALRLANGEVFTGNNQENAAFPSGLCAERVAVFSASSHFPGVAINSIAIYASANGFKLDKTITPCGACRQVIAEYEHLSGKAIRVIMKAEKSNVMVIEGIENLLPFVFNSNHLNP